MKIVKAETTVKYFEEIKLGEVFRFDIAEFESYYYMRISKIKKEWASNEYWNAINIETGEIAEFKDKDIINKIEAHIVIDKE